MNGRILALAVASLLPVTAFAQSAEIGPEAQQLADAIVAEGSALTQDNSDEVQAHLTDMSEEQAMKASVDLIMGGYLVENGDGSFKLVGLGC